MSMVVGRGERLQIMLAEDELAAIDNWRFERRMPSRASAIRELLRRGLAAEGFDLADKHIKSKDFGILARQKSKSARTDGNVG
jgi:metal-responsive CopG/Arc/MetJ family transcriptional regulator